MISLLAGDAQAAGAGLAWLGSGLTVTFLGFFAAWAAWAWWPGNRARLESYARIPLDDGDR